MTNCKTVWVSSKILNIIRKKYSSREWRKQVVNWKRRKLPAASEGHQWKTHRKINLGSRTLNAFLIKPRKAAFLISAILFNIVHSWCNIRKGTKGVRFEKKEESSYLWHDCLHESINGIERKPSEVIIARYGVKWLQFQHSGSKHRWIFVISGPTWSTQWVLGPSELHNETLSQTNNKQL